MQPSLVKRNLLVLKILNVQSIPLKGNQYSVYRHSGLTSSGVCIKGNRITIKHPEQNRVFVIFSNWSSFPFCPSTNSTKQLPVDMEVSEILSSSIVL